MNHDFYSHVAKLPEELQNIVLQNWDETGRPRPEVPHPKSNAVISLLHKNAAEGGKGFLRDMKIVFPDTTNYEAAIYYNSFVAGAQYISERLNSKTDIDKPSKPVGP